MKLQVDFHPKFNGVGDKTAAATAFVKHLDEGKWFFGNVEAKVKSCHNIGTLKEPVMSIHFEVPDPKLEVSEFELVF